MRREAFRSAGGFASFFVGSSPGEDLDLGYRLSRSWKVYYVPAATCIHHQAPAGREATDQHQYLSMRSHFAILTFTMGKKRYVALAHIGLWALVQFLSELASLRHGVLRSDLPRAWSRSLPRQHSHPHHPPCSQLHPRCFRQRWLLRPGLDQLRRGVHPRAPAPSPGARRPSRLSGLS